MSMHGESGGRKVIRSKSGTPFPSLGKKDKRGSSMLLLSHVSVVFHFKRFQLSKEFSA